MKTKVVQVQIRRNLTSAPVRVVLDHEIPILKVIKGTGNVTVLDDSCKGFELKPSEVKPRDELIRLKQKYKGFVVDGQHPVDIAYPDGSRDLELFYKDPSAFDNVGEEEGVDAIADEDDVEVVDDEGNPVEETPESLEVPEANTGINLNDRPAILAALDSAGVPYAKTTATKHLATLLTNSLEQQVAE